MIRTSLLALSILLSASVAFAQTTSATTATVMGTVTDEQGGVLPGVTVTLSGPSMMGVQTQVERQRRTLSLRVDSPWRIQARLRTIRLRDAHARRRASDREFHRHDQHSQMGVATLTESVLVSGVSPVVDTQSTAINTTFDKDTLANLPSARDYWAILSEAPGVKLARIDVGGSAAGTQTDYFVYGTTGQNRPMVEGINSTEGTGSFGNYVDYGSFQEVSIGSGASSAESPVPGVYTVLVSKSGGNRYTGSFYGDYESEDWQSFNIDAAQIAAGVSGRRRPAAARRQPADQLPRRERRRRRFPEEGHGLVVRVGPKPRLVGPLHELSGEAARDASGQLHDQADLSALAEQQADRLLPAEHESAEQPARSAAARRHRGYSSDRRCELPAGLQPASVEGRMELGVPRDRRSSRFARGSSATDGPTRRTAPASATRT